MDNDLLLKVDRKVEYIDVKGIICNTWTEECQVSCSCDPFFNEADWCPRFNQDIKEWRRSELEYRKQLCRYKEECPTSSCESACGSYLDYFGD